MNYIVRYLSAGKMATEIVEARDAASAVAMVNLNSDQSAAFELLSVMPVPTTDCTAESTAVS